jgi:L-fucose isomerase-like protein
MAGQKLILGVVPTKRSFLSMDEAKRQKDRFMARIRSIKKDSVEIVDVDDVCENGIMWDTKKIPAAVGKLKKASIDALFIPFCDFGEEEVAARTAASFDVPVLVWGARDERCNTDESRGRDTQCGMFAATKVMRRFGVKYSYIWNCETESEDFAKGFENFLRVASVLKRLKGLRVAKIGERPGPFMSVMTNEAALIKNLGVTTVPVSPFSVSERAKKLIAGRDEAMLAYYEDLKKRFDCSQMTEDKMKSVAAVKIALQSMMEESECSVGAFECWSAFPALVGVCPCTVLGELSDAGYPLACETDINGAITLAILQACQLYEESPFLADLTIRHPTNDNAELLWHCGPFAYSLKSDESRARIVEGQERFELKQGHLTVCRFDDIDGKYSLFAGEGDTTHGPETNGTYVWFQVDNWKRWEEKLIFGPYIHHIGGIYGSYVPVLREVARYLGIDFDDAEIQGTHSL